MINLQSIKSPEQLASELQINAASHRSYKSYMTMDTCMAMLLSGNMYLSDGSNWNDDEDQKQMREKKAFGKCFFASTVESVAMWMLYSGSHGKNGAMLNFNGKTMRNLLESAEIEVGHTGEGKQFKAKKILNKSDYKIFLTDIVYEEKLSNNKLRITVGEEHYTVDEKMLDHRDIFTKNYAWASEKECRIIVSLDEALYDKLHADGDKTMRIHIPESDLRTLKDRVVRSPVYNGYVDIGTQSTLTGHVKWDL